MQHRLRQFPQPWHAASVVQHEAALAVAHIASEKVWDFSMALFEHQAEYNEEKAKDLTLGQMRESLAELAHKTVGVDKQKVLAELEIPAGSGNDGSKITADLKLVSKIGRQNGIHVTPTVLLDGLIDPSVSSSFGKDEWTKYVQEKLS